MICLRNFLFTHHCCSDVIGAFTMGVDTTAPNVAKTTTVCFQLTQSEELVFYQEQITIVIMSLVRFIMTPFQSCYYVLKVLPGGL